MYLHFTIPIYNIGTLIGGFRLPSYEEMGKGGKISSHIQSFIFFKHALYIILSITMGATHISSAPLQNRQFWLTVDTLMK